MKSILVCLFIFSAHVLSAQDKSLPKSIERGSIIYQASCIGCHMGKGEGIAGIFPPLAKADYLNNTKKTIQAIKFGLEGEITVNDEVYDNMMPSANLSNQEVADVVNYIKNSWGNSSKGKTVTAKIVEAVKE
ncbi:cytochrome c [Sphingobacterium olei]|uniref:Cytochrome c n=1 Tax=Sphingobacterium olei TaxID=2571155 RepID=A0A4U0NHD6_9SPHI|nr:cytochrome c [Sphingobacterium olei]TJZ53606.1 cytochrome c [Sphingobacterium olei]